MSGMLKKGLVILFVIVCSASLAAAGDYDRDRTHDRTYDRLRDGSCLDGDDAIVSPGQMILAKDQKRDQDRDRLRDGSCLDGGAIVSPGQMILAKDQDRDRLRKKDGSCRS